MHKRFVSCVNSLLADQRGRTIKTKAIGVVVLAGVLIAVVMLTGCSLRAYYYCATEFIARTENLKGDKVRVETFTLPAWSATAGTQTHAEQSTKPLTEIDSSIRTISTANAIEHLGTYAIEDHVVTSWRISNKTSSPQNIEIGAVGADRKFRFLNRSSEVYARISSTEILPTHDSPIEYLPIPEDPKSTLPELVIPPNEPATLQIRFTTPKVGPDKLVVAFDLVDTVTNERYGYEFSLKHWTAKHVIATN